MNSLEKLAQFQAEMMEAEPADEQTAQLIQLATLAGPLIGPMLPDDPAELDAHLLKLAAWALGSRSDDVTPAATVAIADPAIGGWRVADGLPVQASLDTPPAGG